MYLLITNQHALDISDPNSTQATRFVNRSARVDLSINRWMRIKGKPKILGFKNEMERGIRKTPTFVKL